MKNSIFCAMKHIDGVAMDSPLGPTLANTFLVYFEKNWLQDCSSDFNSWNAKVATI